jgi:hypothetical protein
MQEPQLANALALAAPCVMGSGRPIGPGAQAVQGTQIRARFSGSLAGCMLAAELWHARLI